MNSAQAPRTVPKSELRILVSAFACRPGAGKDFALGGGEGLLGWNLVRQLSRFHEVWVLSAAQNRAGIETALAREPTPHLYFHYFDLPSVFRPLTRYQGGIQLYAYLWQVMAYSVARRLHRRVRFDAFHHITYANDWMASFTGALLPVTYIRGPGGGAHRTPKRFLCESFLRGRLWERVRALGQWVFRHDPFFILGQRRARALLVCNREALEAIPPKWQTKAHLFPVNGVSSSDLALSESAEAPNHSFRVLTAGKLLSIKGFSLAICAFKAFLDQRAAFPSISEARFTIVGDGPELANLEALVRKLGLERHVEFVAWMPRQQLLATMASYDVFLFLSLRDGGGAVVVEAMAAGRPVICLDHAGPGLHVTENCGIKIAPRSPEQVVLDVAEALRCLYCDAELRRRLGHAARKRATQVYHWDRLGERLREIYAELLEDTIGPRQTQRRWKDPPAVRAVF